MIQEIEEYSCSWCGCSIEGCTCYVNDEFDENEAIREAQEYIEVDE